MICPVCGFDNSAENPRCTKCAATLRSVEDELLASRDTIDEMESAAAPRAESTAPPPPTRRRADPSPLEQVSPPKQAGVVESVGSPKVTPRRGRSTSPPHPAAGVSVQEIGGNLRLTRRWWHTKSIIVAALMTPFLAYGAGELFRASAKWGAMMICAGLIPGLIALLAAYHLLGLLFNRTIIDVSDTLI